MTLDEVISYNHLFADMETKSGDLEVAEYYRDTVKCLEELKELRGQISEYKRLLKAAVEGFEFLGAWMDEYGECTLDCSNCPLHKQSYYCRGWNKKAEVLALIGGSENDT